jgi:hypothetical protein
MIASSPTSQNWEKKKGGKKEYSAKFGDISKK